MEEHEKIASHVSHTKPGDPFDKSNSQYEVQVKIQILEILLYYIEIRNEKNIEYIVKML
jgi:hypothetical protein